MAYGRVHSGFFDSSICEADIATRLVFIAMIVLSDRFGRIDVTREALARRINVPLEEDVNRAELVNIFSLTEKKKGAA